MTDAHQYVTLGVDREVFAVPVRAVREILDLRPIARLPHAPPFLLGMTDVRGLGVPVIDLRARLGRAPAAPTPDSRILVIERGGEGEGMLVGLMADRVFEVTGLDGDRLDPPPEFGARWNTQTIAGIGRRGDAFVIVFDLETLFTAADLAMPAPAGAADLTDAAA